MREHPRADYELVVAHSHGHGDHVAGDDMLADRGFLLTGDTVYPGRLYVADAPTFAASLERLVDFAAARQVTHVMGCHIEMSREPGKDYPMGTRYQPDEPPLQMTVEQLRRVRDAARAATTKHGILVHDDFVIVNGRGLRALVPFLLRTLGRRLRALLPGGR